MNKCSRFLNYSIRSVDIGEKMLTFKRDFVTFDIRRIKNIFPIFQDKSQNIYISVLVGDVILRM